MKKYIELKQELIEDTVSKLESIKLALEYESMGIVSNKIMEKLENEDLLNAKLNNPDSFVQASLKDQLACLLTLRREDGIKSSNDAVRNWATDIFGIDSEDDLRFIFNREQDYDDVRIEILKKMDAPRQMLIPALKIIKSAVNTDNYDDMVLETGLMYDAKNKKIIPANLEQKLEKNIFENKVNKSM